MGPSVIDGRLVTDGRALSPVQVVSAVDKISRRVSSLFSGRTKSRRELPLVAHVPDLPLQGRRRQVVLLQPEAEVVFERVELRRARLSGGSGTEPSPCTWL